eukprot:TRINITY_DN3472_c0_g1_i3.p1 TRINITY_DN3472_c0_g1~~TRINITY_DN3472_c0_g1_i3.p1  ORF type:complete len:309 (-),score=61.30 TRINITY_DN3472_c0_g1_i3:144-1019(-)
MDERSSLLTPSHDSPADHTPPAPNATAARLRQWTYVAVEGEMDSAVEFGLLALIFFNVAALMASTVPTSSKCFGSACERWGDTYEGVFETLEAVSVVVFTIEYFARLWACMEEPAIAAEGPLKGRVTYATRFFLLVDLASILPWWVAVMPGVPESPDFTTALRVFRLFRLLKAEKYISAFGLLAEVLREKLDAADCDVVLRLYVLGDLCDAPVPNRGRQPRARQLFPIHPRVPLPHPPHAHGGVPVGRVYRQGPSRCGLHRHRCRCRLCRPDGGYWQRLCQGRAAGVGPRV